MLLPVTNVILSHAERESQHLYPCQEVLAGPGVQILPIIIRWASGQGTQVTIGGLTPTLETSLLGKNLSTHILLVTSQILSVGWPFVEWKSYVLVFLSLFTQGQKHILISDVFNCTG